MPKIRWPPPPGILSHLLERFRDGRIAVADFVELKHFLESDGDVPQGELTDLFATSRDEMYASRNKQQWPGSLA